MKTRKVFLRPMFCLLIALILMPGCQPKINTATPTSQATQVSQPASSGIDQELVDRFLAALEWLNAAPAFSYEGKFVEGVQTITSIPGQPTIDSPSMTIVSDRGSRLEANGQINVAVKRKFDFVKPENLFDILVESRLVDGQVYLMGGFEQPSPDLPEMPDGWLPVYGTSSLNYWSNLDNESNSSLAVEMKGDALSLLTGKPIDHFRRALTSSLDSISLANGMLDDGSPAQVITAIFKPAALLELMRWVDLTRPVESKALSAVQGTPLTVNLYLDEKDRPAIIELKIIVNIVDLDIGGLEGLPDGATWTAHDEFVNRVKILVDDRPEAVPAPAAGQMAVSPTFSGSSTSVPFPTLSEFDQQINQAANSGQMDAFWKALDGVDIPLIFSDYSVFLYRGKASQVSWQGDWSDRLNVQGQLIGDDETWWAYARLPEDARLEYKIQVDDQQPMIDPLNPNTETGGLGTNSVVFMPGYVAPDYVLSKTGVAPGQLTENLTIDSTNLGYSVNYRVYTPSGYEKLSELPVLYVTDGQDFLQFGKLDISLDNLIAAGHMRPIIAVFIDPRDVQTGKNLREELFLDNPSYGDFIANELVPVIDQAYRTNPTAEARAILGASHGGYFSVYFALHHADKFHLIGALSPSIWHNQGIVDEYQDAEKLPLKFYIGTGTWSDANYHSALLVDALKEKGYLVEYLECNEGHSYANWRGKFKQLLAYFFPAQEEGQ